MPRNTRKLLIAVLMGGPSAEHEISLRTGRAFFEHLNRKRYVVRPVTISKKNEWFVGRKRVGFEGALHDADVAMLAFHGDFGEDGRMQAFLEHHGVPYTGSGVIASALGMDKLLSRNIFRAHGIFVPRTAPCTRLEFHGGFHAIQRKIMKFCGNAPWMVKPRSRGSSVGVSIVKTVKDLPKAVSSAFRFDDNVLIEEYLAGTEVTVPILEKGTGQPEILPLVLIRPKGSAFFDYHEKYSGAEGAEEIVPARISKSLWQKAVEAGLAAYRLLGCRGYARVDVIISQGRPWVLEVNTLPGMTPVSIFPKAARAAGVEFSALLDIIIDDALSNRRRH